MEGMIRANKTYFTVQNGCPPEDRLKKCVNLSFKQL